MKTTTQITTTQNSLNRMVMIVLFALFLLSSVGSFGQNAKVVVTPSAITFDVTIASTDETVASTQNTFTTNTTLNFVSWFMGTKQTPNSNQSGEVLNTKKQMMTSGIAPNRLLIKAFLKKASDYNSTIA